MITFLRKLRSITFTALWAGGLALVVTMILSSLLFDLNPSLILGWFCTIVIFFFALIILLAIICFLIWFAPLNTIMLGVVLCAVFFTVVFFIAKNNPLLNLDKIIPIALEYINQFLSSALK